MKVLKYMLNRQPMISVLVIIVLVFVTTAFFFEFFASLIEPRTMAESLAKLLVGLLLLLILAKSDTTEIGIGMPPDMLGRCWHVMLLMGLTIPLKFLMDQVKVTELVFTQDHALAWLLRNLASGVWEESLFRGICFYLLVRAWGTTRSGLFRAAITQAMLFGALHLTSLTEDELGSVLFQVAGAAFAGLGFVGLVVYSRSIWPAVALHASINGALSIDNFFAGPGYDFPDYFFSYRVIAESIMLVFVGLPGLWCLTRAPLFTMSTIAQNKKQSRISESHVE